MNKFNMILVSLAAILFVYCTIVISDRFEAFDMRITNLEIRLDERQKAEDQLLQELQDLNAKTEEIRRLEEERKLREQQHAMAIEIAKNGLSIHDDLVESTVALNADDINRIIDNYTTYQHTDSVLKGHGEAFITASRETGLNPIYLLAHAFVESGYGTSHYAKTRNNFFGINAVDSNPDLAYVMGDDVDAGIIAGAVWIKSNFYVNGYTTLKAMHDGGYATNPNWAHEIQSVANYSVRYL